MRVIDVGMFDGSDSRYYLECGHQVLAIEANPALCASVREYLSSYIRSGQLTVLNIAVSNEGAEVELKIAGQDLGASSLYADFVANRYPLGSYRVPARRFADILREHGPADFIKIDIEGADRDCILSLTAQNAPPHLSFEAPADVAEPLHHLSRIGYRRFKFIQQMNFRSLDRQNLLIDRIVRKIFHVCGYAKPQYVRRGGRFFKLEHSAGPAPWESDGAWLNLEQALQQWRLAEKSGWYDVHVAR